MYYIVHPGLYKSHNLNYNANDGNGNGNNNDDRDVTYVRKIIEKGEQKVGNSAKG